MKYTDFVKLTSTAVLELQIEKGNNISEKDIQERIISIYNSEHHRTYLLKKECYNKTDIVIYRKKQNEENIHSIYELKTYFKDFEEIGMDKIRQDFVKLYNRRQINSNIKAYFLMISTYEHLEYYSKHNNGKNAIDPLYKNKKASTLNTRNKNITFIPRKEYEGEQFRISIWEIL